MKLNIEILGAETEEEAQELLIKALTNQAKGGSHKEDFQDPAARDVVRKMIKSHDKMVEKMLREINKAIDESL